MRVLIVEPSAVFARGLETILKAHNMSITGIAYSQADAVRLGRALQADVALVSLLLPELPGGTREYLTGLATIRSLKSMAPALHILALGASPDAYLLVEIVRAGASGFVDWGCGEDELVESVRAAARGGVVLTDSQLAVVLTPAPFPAIDLTNRERDVLRLLSGGKTNQEIGNTLNISLGTVRTHVSNILGKLAVATRREAAAEARRRGIV